MTLNNVVLPAPFGPMSPVTRPSSTSRSTPWRACTPPKRTSTAWTSSSANARHLLGNRGRDLGPTPALAPHGEIAEPLEDVVDRPVGVAGDGDGAEPGGHEYSAIPEKLELMDAEDGGERREGNAAHQRTRCARHAGRRQDEQERETLCHLEVDRAHRLPESTEQRSGEARERRRDREYGELRSGDVHPEHRAGGRAVAHRRQPPPESSAP